MERSWLDTIQLLGLDVMVMVVFAMLVALEALHLLRAIRRRLGGVIRRRRRTLPTSPRDVYTTQEWGPSH